MAKFDYARMQATASRLLDRFSQGVITLTKPGTETPGPNPWDPPVVTDPVTHTLNATAKPVSEEFINGTTIVATDIEITAAVFGADPDPADQMEIDGQPMTIIEVMRIPAAGTVVVWKLIVRG